MRILLICSAVAVAICACSKGDCDAEGIDVQDAGGRRVLSLDELLVDTANVYEAHLDSAPEYGCVRMRSRRVGSLRKAFNDSNYIHVGEARRLGIDPITDLQSAWEAKRPLVEIVSCREYYVDELTHSYPFLVPEAAGLLSEIGSRFNDSLAARGGGDYRIKVTSVLRTPATVKRLRRINGNATEESAHQFGTTFDISFSKFICDRPGVNRTFEDLKNLLAEVLDDLRLEGRCYVKYEVKQACFHITAKQMDL